VYVAMEPPNANFAIVLLTPKDFHGFI